MSRSASTRPSTVCWRSAAAGGAIALVCERLTSGTVTAIDRSDTAVEAARRRNAESAAAGSAVFHMTSLEEADFTDASFDKIFAVTVNRWPAPSGALCLCWEPPDARRAGEIAGKVEAVVAAHGFATDVRRGATSTGSCLVCVRATAPASAGERHLGGLGTS
jgi:hypothetical protein